MLELGDLSNVGFEVFVRMQLHIGAEHFGKVIKRGIIKRGCS
jgi:hypothetical protein